jgi:glycosyltransferase involved in cell wall biosynthesis
VTIPYKNMLAWRPPKSLLGSKHATAVYNKPPTNFLHRVFLIFAPWCDQGLGIQARNYVQWLTAMQYQVVVFACKPSKVTRQASPDEWVVTAHVHTSTYHRENVPSEEVLAVAQQHHVTDALMLETCYPNMFAISNVLGNHCIRVFAVPNIEMVRRTEIQNFAPFSRTLCNNQYTLDVLQYFKVPNPLCLFPFALYPDESVPLADLYRGNEPVRFLLVGGLNAEKRKQVNKVVAAFQKAFKTNNEAHLTVLIQGGHTLPKTAQNITVINQHLTYGEVSQHYAKSHVVVMCSRAEGIGLAFHEALRSRCAVLTLNVAMFKELIAPNVNGWLVKCEAEPGDIGAQQLGNDSPIVHTYTFQIANLVAAFSAIKSMPSDIARLQLGARNTYECIFSKERVVQAMHNALRLSL